MSMPGEEPPTPTPTPPAPPATRSGPSATELIEYLRRTNALNTDIRFESMLSNASMLSTDLSMRPMVIAWGCYAVVMDCGGAAAA